MALEAAGNSPAGSGVGHQPQDAVTTLLRMPRIFMLALVWESPQVRVNRGGGGCAWMPGC